MPNAQQVKSSSSISLVELRKTSKNLDKLIADLQGGLTGVKKERQAVQRAIATAKKIRPVNGVIELGSRRPLLGRRSTAPKIMSLKEANSAKEGQKAGKLEQKDVEALAKPVRELLKKARTNGTDGVKTALLATLKTHKDGLRRAHLAQVTESVAPKGIKWDRQGCNWQLGILMKSRFVTKRSAYGAKFKITALGRRELNKRLKVEQSDSKNKAS